MANQTAIYQYTWKHGWNIDASEHGSIGGGLPSNAEIIADVKNGLKKATFEQIAEKFAQLGRWLIVDSIAVDVTTLLRYPPVGGVAPPDHIEGTTTTVFRTDATPDTDFAPATGFMGWDDLLVVILGTIISVIMAHQTLFFVLLIILALIWYNYAGGFKGTLFGQGSGSLADIGTIIAIAILGFGGLLVLSSVLGKEKHRRSRKG